MYNIPTMVAYDLFLVWANARQYNVQGSQIYNDADSLEHQMKHLWKQHCPPLPKFKHLMRPEQVRAAGPVQGAAGGAGVGASGSGGGAFGTPGGGGEKERKRKKMKLGGEVGGTLGGSGYAGGFGTPTPAATAGSSVGTPLKLTLGGATPAAAVATPSAPKIKLSLGGARPTVTATPPPQQPYHHSTPSHLQTPTASTGTPLTLKLGGSRLSLSHTASSPAPTAPQPTSAPPPPQHQPPAIPRLTIPPRSQLGTPQQQPAVPRIPVPPRAGAPALPGTPTATPGGPSRPAVSLNLFGRPPLPTIRVPTAHATPGTPAFAAHPHPAATPSPRLPSHSPAPPALSTPAPSATASPAPTNIATPSAAGTPVPAAAPGTPGVIAVPPPPPPGAADAKPSKERKAERKARQRAERKVQKDAEAKAAREAKAAGLAVAAKVGAGTGDVKREGVADVQSGWMENVRPEVAQRTYLEIVSRLKGMTDVMGRGLAGPLMTVPDKEARPDYHQLVSNPVSLELIQSRVMANLYPSAEAFDRDLYSLFEIAKLFIKPDAPGHLYTDLVVLQRLYQALTKRSSPGEANPAVPVERGAVEDKVFLSGINFKGQTFRVGDWVHLVTPTTLQKPLIAQVFKLFTHPGSARRSMTVCWYVRPEQTHHDPARTFLRGEVFKTGTFTDVDVEEVLERCVVMYVDKWLIGRPKGWQPSLPTYVCGERYKDADRAFKKIKNWSSCVPDEVKGREDELDLFPEAQRMTLEAAPRVRSPLAVDSGTGVSEAGAAAGRVAGYAWHANGEPGGPGEVEEAKDRAVVEARRREGEERARREREEREKEEGRKAKAVGAVGGAGSGGGRASKPLLVSGAVRVGGTGQAGGVGSGLEEASGVARVDPSLTPVEVAAAKESFDALPEPIGKPERRCPNLSCSLLTHPRLRLIILSAQPPSSAAPQTTTSCGSPRPPRPSPPRQSRPLRRLRTRLSTCTGAR